MKDTGIERLVDVRLNNASRLAGFARRADLPFFLEKLCGVEYITSSDWPLLTRSSTPTGRAADGPTTKGRF